MMKVTLGEEQRYNEKSYQGSDEGIETKKEVEKNLD